MEIQGYQIIGFEYSHEGSKTYEGFNPSTGESLPQKYYEATSSEVDKAVRLAHDAFKTYRKKGPMDKATFLNTIADEILALGDDLVDICVKETALPAGRIQGERGRTVNQLKLFASLLEEGSWVDARTDTAQPDRSPVPKPDVRRMDLPLGPVGVFGASNFPLAFSVAGGDTASALAAGCPVVVKVHPAHPGTSELVSGAINKAARLTGMPEGVFNMLHGTSPDVSLSIVTHPQIQAVGFTGSYNAGKSLFDAGVRRPEPIPVYAEMGSTNPVFILPEALKERGEQIANGLANSVTLGVGQFCTNPGVFVSFDSEETNDFFNRTGELINQMEAGPMLTPGIRESYESRIDHFSKREGVKIVGQGQNGQGKNNEGKACLFKAPINLIDEFPDLSEEVFGPSSIGFTAKTKQDMLHMAENLQGHLTATIHATPKELEEYKDLVEILENKVGRLIINGFPTGVEVCHSMHHGGPFPATTDVRSTSVGTAAIKRFVKPVCYQDFPPASLPDALKNDNPLNIWRLVNGELTKDTIGEG